MYKGKEKTGIDEEDVAPYRLPKDTPIIPTRQ